MRLWHRDEQSVEKMHGLCQSSFQSPRWRLTKLSSWITWTAKTREVDMNIYELSRMVLIGVCHGAYWFWVMFTTRPMRISSQTDHGIRSRPCSVSNRSRSQELAAGPGLRHGSISRFKKLLNCRGLKMAKWCKMMQNGRAEAGQILRSTSVNCATVGETVSQQLGLALIPDARAASLAPGLVTKWWIWSLGKCWEQDQHGSTFWLYELGHNGIAMHSRGKQVSLMDLWKLHVLCFFKIQPVSAHPLHTRQDLLSQVAVCCFSATERQPGPSHWTLRICHCKSQKSQLCCHG